jgi:hypothetical protein
LALSAGGAYLQYQGSKQAEEGQRKAEQARQSSATLDARRRRRQIIREQQVARATALSNATNQGAGEGSGLQGGYGSISGQANTAISGINQQETLGNAVFAANRQTSQGRTTASLGGAFQTVGGTILQNRQAISQVGTYAFG